MFKALYTHKHTHGDGDRHIQNTHTYVIPRIKTLSVHNYMWPDSGKLSQDTTHEIFTMCVNAFAKIDHVNANYTELYFSKYIFSPECGISHSVNCRRKLIKFCSNSKDFGVLVLIVSKSW